MGRQEGPATAFGDAVRGARTGQGLTQDALATLAGVNKETVMRIERGLDARVTTIGKLRKVLPELAAHQGAMDTTMDETTAMATKIGHILLGFTSQERLFQIKHYVLQQLQDEHMETRSPAYLAEQRVKQERAESNLIARHPHAKRHGRKNKRANGGAHNQ